MSDSLTSQYELERLRNIEANAAQLAELGLLVPAAPPSTYGPAAMAPGPGRGGGSQKAP